MQASDSAVDSAVEKLNVKQRIMKVNTENTGLSQSKAAIVASIAIIINLILAPAAYFGILPGIFDTGDAVATFENIISSEQQFRIAIFFLTLNFISDIVVFWALYYFLKPVNKGISLLMLVFGVIHVAVGLLSINNLTGLLHLVNLAASNSSFNAAMFHTQTATAINAFNWAWQAGFVMFGVHLMLRGYLFLKAGCMKKWLGIALMTAAAGYLIDGFGQILFHGYDTSFVSNYVGILEVLLPVWLLVKGRNAELQPTS